MYGSFDVLSTQIIKLPLPEEEINYFTCTIQKRIDTRMCASAHTPHIYIQIRGDLDENPTGQALADLIHKEQKILAKEVRWLQNKAWKARRRAGERREHRNKTQTPS